MKHIHRLIVTSRTYQLSSSVANAAPKNVEIDQANRFHWKYNVRRLEAEVVRDNVLAVAEVLDPTLGGPDIDHSKGEGVARRSIYFQTAYEKQMRLLVLFDGPNPAECYRRSSSVTPQQALALANSSLTLTQSRRLARRLWDKVSLEREPDRKFVHALFERLLGRLPNPAEKQLCLEFLDEQTKQLADTTALTSISP